tara:strand:+ start:9866 stop:10588 length:723 start_codon:yes stop_codon:yes gene_type:complete
VRVIARIDIKNEFVIKGINFEGLRKVGDPLRLAEKYYKEGIDEIVFIDAVASLYERNHLFKIIEHATENIFCPITLGGGIRSLSDIEKALNSGADKVSINSYATENPSFIKKAVDEFGSSTITVNVDAKKIDNNKWEVYKFYGREKTGLELVSWIDQIQNLDCGEILLSSIDNEGLCNGFDIELLDSVYNGIKKPLIFSGGFGSINDIHKLKKYKNISISIASALHYNKTTLDEINKIKL